MKHRQMKLLAAAAALAAAVSASAQTPPSTGASTDTSKSSGLADNPKHDECAGLTTTALRDCLRAQQDRLDAAGAGATTPVPRSSNRPRHGAPNASGGKAATKDGPSGAAGAP
jgi:hypothetical protein